MSDLLDTMLLPGSGLLLVAVSGGCDSMVLWDLLARVDRWQLLIWYLDHGIRPDSAHDAELIRTCALPGERCIERADVPALAREWHCGLEEAGRRQRYARLEIIARRAGAAAVVTAHHRDDHAETIILNLLRGSHGLVGVPAQRPLTATIPVIRPLLAVPKAELQRWAIAHGVPWREDTTNVDLGFARNRIRHAVLPTFEAAFPGFASALIAAVRPADSPLREWLRVRRLPVSRAIIARLTTLAVGSRTTLGGRLIVRTADGWYDEPEQMPLAPPAIAIGGPGTWQRGDRTLEVTVVDHGDAWTIAPESVRGSLQWRAPVIGERWCPLGCAGTQTLHATAARRQVPARMRAALDVLADDEGPLWMAPGVVAERARVRTSGWRISIADSVPGILPAARPGGV